MSERRDIPVCIPISGGRDLVPASHILSQERSSSTSNSYELGSFESIGDMSTGHVISISLETSCDSLFHRDDDEFPPPVPPPLLTSDQIVEKARRAFASGRTKDVAFRKSQLEAIMRMMTENTKLICDAVNKDLRKSPAEGRTTEVGTVTNECLYALNGLQRWTKPTRVAKTIATMMDKTFVHHEPYGVALIIGAWNYPIHLTFMPLIGAVSAGNCVVVKPSELAPASSRVVAELLPRYMDPECYHVVEGAAEETTQLLRERWDYIFYTGSSRVGKIVYEAAIKNLTPVTLELGGKSPVFFDESISDIELAAKRIVWGKCLNSGQTCVAPDYLLCTRQTQAKLVQVIPKILKDFYGSDVQKSTDYSRIVNENNFNRLVKLIQATKGKVVIGGNSDLSDKYIEPTVVTDVSVDDPLMQDELFGPILPIVAVSSVDEAIDFINKREKPLALYVYTNRNSVYDRFLRETSSGALVINDCMLQLTVEGMPFGGVGHSGMGAYHGKASFLTFSHSKSVLHRDYNPIAEMLAKNRFPPSNNRKEVILTQLLKTRNLPTDSLPYLMVFSLGIAVTVFWQVILGHNP